MSAAELKAEASKPAGPGHIVFYQSGTFTAADPDGGRIEISSNWAAVDV